MRSSKLYSLTSGSIRHLSSGITPKPFSEMPGMKGLALNILKLAKMQKEAAEGNVDVSWRLHLEFGPIYRMKILGTWLVSTSSPKAAEVAFRNEGQYPSRGIFEDNMMWIFRNINLPPPMFFSGGEIWKKTRSAAAKQVIPRRVGNFIGPLCGIAEELLDHLEEIKDESGNISDITPELAKWAFQGVSYFVYSKKIDIYSGTDPQHKEFIEAGLDYIESITTIARALPLYKWFPTKAYKDYVKKVMRMQKAGKQILDDRYSEIKNAIASGYVDETKAVGLLDQWLIEGKFTEEEAICQSNDMLSAGIDTTSNTAAFLLYELAKHPEVQDQLVQEISSVVGEKEHPTWEDLQKMTLVRNCVKETLRMYVPVAGVGRVMADDMVLMGYEIPAGTTVIYNGSAATKDETVFEDPKKFKPERWNRENSENIHPFSSLPFGFGPRACYGRRLAELEMYILMTKMLPKYHLATNIKDIKLKVKVLLKPNLPLHLSIKPRS